MQQKGSIILGGAFIVICVVIALLFLVKDKDTEKEFISDSSERTHEREEEKPISRVTEKDTTKQESASIQKEKREDVPEESSGSTEDLPNRDFNSAGRVSRESEATIPKTQKAAPVRVVAVEQESTVSYPDDDDDASDYDGPVMNLTNVIDEKIRSGAFLPIDIMNDPATAPEPHIGNDAEGTSITDFDEFDAVSYLENYSRGDLISAPIDIGTSPTIEYIAKDAHHQRILIEFRDMQNWAAGNRIIVSEMGIANNDDDEAYMDLMDTFFEVANLMNVSATGWAVGEWWGDYDVLIADPRIGASDVSRPFTDNLSTDTYFRGVNLAGAEFGMGSNAEGNIGSLSAYNYTYHEGSSMWQKIRDMGFTHVRFPFRLERLFNTDGSFDTNEKAHFEVALGNARAAGIKIVLDPHNYAALQINGQKHVLGSSSFTQSLYNTMMGNLAQLSNSHTDVVDMIALMNEPKNVAPSTWEGIAQSALNAIRNAGWKGQIEVPTGNWQGIQDAPRVHSAPWITDSENNFMYGVHQYYDLDHSGSYQRSYAEDETLLLNYFTPGTVSLLRP